MAAPTDKMTYQLYCGVDIAARTFTASTCRREETPTKASSYEQTPQGFELLKKLLVSKGYAPDQTLVVMEATGTYWIELATYLHAAGFAPNPLSNGSDLTASPLDTPTSDLPRVVPTPDPSGQLARSPPTVSQSVARPLSGATSGSGHSQPRTVD